MRMGVPKAVSSRWRIVAGAVVGAAAGVAVAVAALRHPTDGGETAEGAAYLIAVFGWPTSFLLAPIPWFGQLAHLSQFAFTALALNYAVLGLLAGGFWHRRVTRRQGAA